MQEPTNYHFSTFPLFHVVVQQSPNEPNYDALHAARDAIMALRQSDSTPIRHDLDIVITHRTADTWEVDFHIA